MPVKTKGVKSFNFMKTLHSGAYSEHGRKEYDRIFGVKNNDDKSCDDGLSLKHKESNKYQER